MLINNILHFRIKGTFCQCVSKYYCSKPKAIYGIKYTLRVASYGLHIGSNSK